jgi:hypothetical protein
MVLGRDFSCELIGLIVLTALSAVSHFWYVLIGVTFLAALVLVSAGLYVAFLRATREILKRFESPTPLEHAAPVEASIPTSLT